MDKDWLEYVFGFCAVFFKFIVYSKERLCDKIYSGHEFECLYGLLPLAPFNAILIFLTWTGVYNPVIIIYFRTRRIKVQKNRRISQLTLFVTLFLVTGSGLFGCAGRISDLNIFTDAQEVQLGKQFSHEIEKEIKIYSDPVVTAYIDQLGQHLANHSQRQNITYPF